MSEADAATKTQSSYHTDRVVRDSWRVGQQSTLKRTMLYSKSTTNRFVVDLLYSKSTTNLRLIAQMEFELIWRVYNVPPPWLQQT